MKRILITGGNGQLGWELQRTLGPLGELIVPDRKDLDLSDPDSIRDALRKFSPDYVINAGAYTQVDAAESDESLASAVNGRAPGILAEELKSRGAALIHFSTDYVFDGKKGAPYLESDTPCPVNVYGMTKLEGERAVQSVGGRYLIFRTSWVYGSRGKNFLLTMLRLAGSRRQISVVNDQFGAPTWCRSLAQVTSMAVYREMVQCDVLNGNLFHLSSRGETSWYGFSRMIFDLARGAGWNLALEECLPISSAEYPVAATRPVYSVLDSERFSNEFGLGLPRWENDLALCIADMPSGQSGQHSV